MTIEVIEEAEFLKIALSEAFDFDSFMEFLPELGTKKAKNFLIDGAKLENTDLSHKERFDIGYAAVEHFDVSAKYVVIWPARDINYFAISVMRIHGFNIKIFATMPLAKQWLLT